MVLWAPETCERWGAGGGNRAKLPRAADLLEAPAGLLCAGTRDS